jgi:hypothetical protein
MSSVKSLIFIVGMHRSGTSAVTRLINLLGADLGHHLIEPMEGVNRDGFWENKKIIEFNEDLLNELGVSWYSLNHISFDNLAESRIAALKEQACTILTQEFSAANIPVIKDPRICRLLPFWLDVAHSLEYNPIIIQIIRDPIEVAQSLETRDGFSISYWLILWLLYTVDAQKALASSCHLTIQYSQLIENWRNVIESIESLKGFKESGILSSQTIDEKLGQKIDEEISPARRHQISSADLGADSAALQVQSIYNELKKEAILSRSALAAASDLIEPLQSMHVITDLADVMAMRGQALSRAGEDLSYAQSVVDERDKQLAAVVQQKEYAESIVDERDKQLAAVVQQKEYAESIVQMRDRQLHKVTEHPILRHLLKLLIPDLHNGKD